MRSNDDIPLDEIAHATFAKNEGYWMLFEDPEGHDWDVTRPLREQWPWCYPNPSARAVEAVAEFRSQMPATSEPMPFETKHAELIDLVKELPVSPIEPREGWQERTLAKIDEFAPVDTASREPWRADGETQSTGDLETLIERSSVGQGLRNIRENGIDAELKQLEEEMKLLPDAHGGADL